MSVSMEVIFGFVGMMAALFTVGAWIVKAQNKLFKEATELIKEAVDNHSQNATAHSDIREDVKSTKFALRDFVDKDEKWKKDHELWGRELIEQMEQKVLNAIQNHRE